MPMLPLLLAMLATAPLERAPILVLACPDPALETALQGSLRQGGFTVANPRQPEATRLVDLQVEASVKAGGGKIDVSITATRAKTRQDVLRWTSSKPAATRASTNAALVQAAAEFTGKLQEALRKPAGVIRVSARGIHDTASLEALARVFEAAGAKVLTSALAAGGQANLTVQYPGPPDELFGPLVSASAPAFKTMGVNDMSEDSLSITLTRAAP